MNGKKTPRIAISYRRDDTAAEAGRIYDRLSQAFGADSVFIDIDRIPPGTDFREHIAEALGKADVLLVLMGRGWTGDVSGLPANWNNRQRRIDRTDDWVRMEVETALKRGIPVVPVLLQGRVMPSESELPESLRPIAYRQAFRIDMGPDFAGQVARLAAALSKPEEDDKREPKLGPDAESLTLPAPLAALAAVLMVIGTIAIALLIPLSVIAALQVGDRDVSFLAIYHALFSKPVATRLEFWHLALIPVLILTYFVVAAMEQQQRPLQITRPSTWYGPTSLYVALAIDALLALPAFGFASQLVGYSPARDEGTIMAAVGPLAFVCLAVGLALAPFSLWARRSLK